MSATWEKFPAVIESIEKEPCFGDLRIIAVLIPLNPKPNFLNSYQVTWFYGVSVKTDSFHGNNFPSLFHWAYENAEKGMTVQLHHCNDDNCRYFYKC